MEITLNSEATIKDLAMSIGEADFLQFSSPRNIIIVKADLHNLMTIPSHALPNSKVEYFVDKYEKACKYIKSDQVSCVWPNGL